MKKKEVTNEYQPSSKEYIIALKQYPSFIKLLNVRQKPYASLVDWFLSGCPQDNYDKLISIKELADKTQIRPSNVRVYLSLIYEEIYQLNMDEPQKFLKTGQKLCHCSFDYIGNYATYYLGLDVIPRTGEQFDFWFIKPKCSSGNFYVKSVSYEIENEERKIFISLTSQAPNIYLEFIKEKAFINKRISSSEYFGTMDLILEEKLLKMFNKL